MDRCELRPTHNAPSTAKSIEMPKRQNHAKFGLSARRARLQLFVFGAPLTGKTPAQETDDFLAM
jgi:hypothetical protein